MSALKQKLITRIKQDGPISVADYMTACLSDLDGGYYMIREPFGRKGDFITAPEVSQMFGELLGVWVVSTWQALGSPLPCTIAEIGPGRGTLMSDLLRAAAKIAPQLINHAQVVMVETSARLTAVQQKKLEKSAPDVSWHKSLSTLPDQPLILIANELMDALPSRQFIKQGEDFVERFVGLDPQDQLCFTVVKGAPVLAKSLLPANQSTMPEGTIFEHSPARSDLMQQICQRIVSHKGAALLIDYGSLETGFGDTLQALYKHQYQDVFAMPGEADITTHVDFARLSAVAQQMNCHVSGTEQGSFLLQMGLLDRAGQLGTGKSHATQEQIRDDVERLAAPDQMGSLFKVLSVSYPRLKTPE